ncbi:hypothetical protein SDC9_189039 [bioreactor metagenome]|uniref:Uncharacterized protein n=1 Tax=bioreactor metagenome TaxID=1076179 RepID=A0A645I1W3_9ZZZZ
MLKTHPDVFEQLHHEIMLAEEVFHLRHRNAVGVNPDGIFGMERLFLVRRAALRRRGHCHQMEQGFLKIMLRLRHAIRNIDPRARRQPG